MNKIRKVYNVIIDDEDETSGMLRNSFVDMPAVEYTKLNFAKNDKINKLAFSEDKLEQTFMSVSILADTPIFRYDEEYDEEYEVVFPKESIRKIVNKFIISGNQNEVSFNHSDLIIEGVYLVEHFITKKGVIEAPAFKDLPDGSWVTSYYVPDLELYNKLKNDKNFNGFSIEIQSQLAQMFSKHNSIVVDKEYDEIVKILYSEDLTDEAKRLEIKKVLNK